MKSDHGMDWRKAAATVQWNVHPFIDGRYCPSFSVDSFDNINPRQSARCVAFVWAMLPTSTRPSVLHVAASTTVFGASDRLHLGRTSCSSLRTSLSDMKQSLPYSILSRWASPFRLLFTMPEYCALVVASRRGVRR